MNFQNLEYFLTTASEGNITRAAERLHVSQQALSNQIARLEQELGCKLFERKQNLVLTYAGLQFKASAEKILDIQRQTATEHRVYRNFTNLYSVGPSPFYDGALLIWLNYATPKEE